MDKLLIGLMLAVGVFIFPKGSAAGVEQLKALEDFSPYPYKDGDGKYSIGFGHQILSGENFNFITVDYGEKLLYADILKVKKIINQYVKVPLSTGQYDALVSFIYNIGVNAFIKSKVLIKLNARDYLGAAKEFKKWIYITVENKKIVSLGLRRRREIEYKLFMS